MSPSIIVSVTSTGQSTQRHELSATATVGREGCEILTPQDPQVSRRHARIEPAGDHVVITDLSSSNGTWVNGVRIAEPTVVNPSDSVSLGSATVLSVTLDDGTQPVAAPVGTGIVVDRFGTPAERTSAIERDGIRVVYVENSPGEKAAKSMLDSARRARAKLAGFGAEPAIPLVTINLVDPLYVGDSLVTSGSILDAPSAQLWCVVTSESRPEDPTLSLALIFGADLPSRQIIEPLIAGYGLHLAGQHGARPAPFMGLDEPLRTQTAAAFVHHLARQRGDESVRQLLAAEPGRLDATARDLFGGTLAQLERSWVTANETEFKSGQFVRLAITRLWPYRLRQAEVFVYMLMSLAFTSVYPFVTRRLFDDVIPSAEFSRVWKLLGVLLIAFAVSLVAGVRQSYLSATISASVIRDLRQEMFDRVQRLHSSALGNYQQGELLSRMFNDIGQLQNGLSAMINTGIMQFVSLAVTGVIMLSVNLMLALIVLAGAPVIAYVYRRMGAGAQKRSLELQERNAALLSVAAENYRAGPLVKLFRLERHEGARFSKAADHLVRSTQRVALFNGYFGLSVNFIVTMLQMVILGLGAWLIFEGRFTLGGLVAFLGVMGEFLGPVTQLTTLGQTMQQSLGSLKRIEEITAAPIEADGSDLPDLEPFRERIELRDISFSYTPERRTLDDVSVVIPAGTRTAFVGPSGCGKSTVLNVLMQLITPDEGTMLVDGVPVTERSLASLRRQFGVVFQDPFLFDISLAANIALGADNPSPQQIRAAAEAAEVTTFADQLPLGLDSPAGEGGSHLSGGQRQRVSIARALVANPRILILDEATSALDAATERAINDTLDRALDGQTVIAVTHRLTSITDYDNIVVLVAGRIEAQGTHDALVRQGGTYARLWSEQTGAPMPERAPFDSVGALAKLPPLRNIQAAALDQVVRQALAIHLDTGTTMPEFPGRLLLIQRGRGKISTRYGTVHDVGAGDVLGLGALMGAPEEAILEATEPIDALSLGAEDLRGLFARHGGLEASRQTLVLPANSHPQLRATIGVPAATREPALASQARGGIITEF